MNNQHQKPRILIVDDIVVNLKLLRQILRDDYLISFASSGPKALEIIAMQQPDLILLDIMMPEMDGFEVCQRIKANPVTSEIPIIFITANEDVVDSLKDFDQTGIDYILKPVEAAIVLEKIQRFLGLSAKE
ncbi:MAG: response regulator [Magnetococcus sp. YQC-5]